MHAYNWSEVQLKISLSAYYKYASPATLVIS